MFFMLNSLDERVDVSEHPKYHIVINNVSKFGDDYNLDQIEKDPDNTELNADANLSNEQRIADIKSQLKEGAKNFYLIQEVSDGTKIG